MKKDPVLMAMPYRKAIGIALMVVGSVHVLIGLRLLLWGVP